jgi:hypothetical protein
MSGIWHWIAFGPLAVTLVAYIGYVQRQLRRETIHDR